MKTKLRHFLLSLFLILVMAPAFPAMAKTDGITVFAAASTTNAITDIAGIYKALGKGDIRLSFASSSTLAKQIEQGAPADLFLSANVKWMGYLDKKGLIVKGSRRDILGNRLVLIAPSGSGIKKLVVDKNLDLAPILGQSRLSMGDPDHVPAGIYGKKAMMNLGIWDDIKTRIAPAKDVRAALVLVERAEVPLGQVYATDAAISSKVRVVGLFPKQSHPEIIYPAALVKENQAARAFLVFLQSDPAKNIFEKYGFSIR